MSQTSEEWELSKENIKPIQQGRKTKVLKVALATHPEDIIRQQRQSFENELRTYSGDDPLIVWCEYIKWVEQNFPKGGREGHIKELIERCLSILKNEKKYYDDDRFIDIMLNYAILGGKPIDVYNYMFSNNIGCKSAKLFINWSWVLEQMSNLKKADEILNEGIMRRAEPYEKIQSYYKDFEIRLVGKIKTNIEQNDRENESSRSAFAMLKPQKKNLAPISRTGEAVVENRKMPLILGRQQPQPKSTTASIKVPFKIFNSENTDSSLPVQSQCNIPSDLTSKNYKENEGKPSKWSKVKVKPHGLHLKGLNEAKPGFMFHCDNETEPGFQTPRSVPSTSKILTTRCRTPTSPMDFFERSNPLERNMYPKNKIYGGAEEFSLEEIRAAEWFDRMKNTGQMLPIEQQIEIEENGKTKEELEENTEYLTKQAELQQNHSSNSAQCYTDVSHSDSIMTETEKFHEMLNASKLEVNNKKFQCHIKNNNSELEHNLDNVFSFKINVSNNSYLSDPFENEDSTGNKAAKIVQNVCNSELDEKCAAIYPNNFLSDLNEANQNKQIESTSRKSNSNLPFTFYHDPGNE